MNPAKAGFAALGVVVAIALSNCSTNASSPQATATAPVAVASDSSLNSVYAELKKAGGRVFRLDPAASAVRIYVFRAGPAAKLGHNHVLSAPQFAGFLYVPSTGATTGRFDLEFRLDQLEVDNPDYRSKLGSAYSSTLSVEAIEGTRDHMLGEDNLQADQFPLVRIHSLEISGEAPKLAVRIEVELHGKKREMWVPLSVDGMPDHLTVTGQLVLRQTDFGAQPYSVLGGLIAVRDEVVVEFRLVGE